jgi:hypothetical protein
MRLRTAGLLVLAFFVLAPDAAYATDGGGIGQTCPTNNVTAGPNLSGQTVVCTGGVWTLEGNNIWSTNGSNIYYNGGNVGIGTAAPNSHAALDLSANTNSMLLPVGTTGQEPGSPVAGMVRYNSTISEVEYCNGSAWPLLNRPVPGGGREFRSNRDGLPC